MIAITPEVHEHLLALVRAHRLLLEDMPDGAALTAKLESYDSQPFGKAALRGLEEELSNAQEIPLTEDL
jgi:hypothetical protein